MARKVRRLNLGEHTLDIETRKCNYEKFDFSEVEDFVRELAGGREFQFKAIRGSDLSLGWWIQRYYSTC